MKNTIIRYGSQSALTICTLSIVGWYLGKNLNYSIQEVIGYAGIIVALLFIFFGIKHFRDKENNGIVSFKKGLLIGVLIALIAALVFGLLDMIYIKYINPDFITEYYTHYEEQMQNTLPEAELQIKLAELETQKKLFSNRFMSFLLMFTTVFLIGFIISLISALILQRKSMRNN